MAMSRRVTQSNRASFKSNFPIVAALCRLVLIVSPLQLSVSPCLFPVSWESAGYAVPLNPNASSKAILSANLVNQRVHPVFVNRDQTVAQGSGGNWWAWWVRWCCEWRLSTSFVVEVWLSNMALAKIVGDSRNLAICCWLESIGRQFSTSMAMYTVWRLQCVMRWYSCTNRWWGCQRSRMKTSRSLMASQDLQCECQVEAVERRHDSHISENCNSLHWMSQVARCEPSSVCFLLFV